MFRCVVIATVGMVAKKGHIFIFHNGKSIDNGPN